MFKFIQSSRIGKSGWYAKRDDVVKIVKATKSLNGKECIVYDVLGNYVYVYEKGADVDKEFEENNTKFIGCESYPVSVFSVHKSGVEIIEER